MSLYEFLLIFHVLAAALWFGSGVVMMVLSRRILAVEPAGMSALGPAMAWWAGRAHPAAGLLLLVTGPAMVADADIGFGEAWVLIGLIGLIGLFAYGGGVLGRKGDKLGRDLAEAGQLSPALRADTQGLLRLMGIESVILALIIVDMVVKPG